MCLPGVSVAAGVIHTDFEKGFICAEVMTFEDLKELGDEEAVKKAGKLRQQGKKYVVQDADVIFFKVRACVRASVPQCRSHRGRRERHTGDGPRIGG